MKNLQKEIKSLASLNVDKYVRKTVGKCEENVKNKIVVPLLELLGYNLHKDMDFEYHVENKKADLALLLDNKPKLLVETKDLDESLDNHVNQGLEYAYNKGVEWVFLTNGLEIRIYKSFIPNIPKKDRILFTTTLQKLPQSFDALFELVGKEHLQEAKKLTEKEKSIRESITAKILIEDLSLCRERLFSDLFAQFKVRYKTDEKFKEKIDTWAKYVKMDISDADLIEKLCKEGAYTLINRILFLRICEDKNHIKAKLAKDAIIKWRVMVENPSNLLDIAFKEIGECFEGLYKSPLFDSINFEDIDWDATTINFVLNKLGEHDFSKISKDILGRAYERHIPREERKRLGQFYTPDFVIDYILNRVGISPEKKILDPACGSGGFLMKSYDRLRKQYHKQGWAEEVIHSQILKKNLFGIDLNSFAVQLTVMNLFLKDLDHPTGQINLVKGDALKKLEQLLDFDIDQKESPLAGITRAGNKLSHGALIRRHEPFDIVVGNPPYVSFGLRGVGKVSRGEYKYLKNNYPNSAEYKISIYAIFMDRGIQLLGERGRFGFVVPDSFLIGRFFSKLRRYILNSCRIIEIVLFKEDFWKYGVVGLPVIIILEKESNINLRLTNKLTARLCSNAAELDHATFKSCSYEQSYFESIPYNRFRLFFDGESKNLVYKMEKQSTKLGNVVTFASGLIGKKGKNQIVSTKKLGQDWLPGLVSGREINKYSLVYEGGYILYDTAKLKSGFKDANYFAPKILMRQTGDSIIATYDENNFLCLNNLHVGNLTDKNYDLKYVLCCINSRLINHYYHLISLELGRTMAQLDIETIELLPIKLTSKEEQMEIVTLVDKMLSLNKRLNNHAFVDQRKAIQKEIDAIGREMDKKVYKLYGLTKREIALVEGKVG